MAGEGLSIRVLLYRQKNIDFFSLSKNSDLVEFLYCDFPLYLVVFVAETF